MFCMSLKQGLVSQQQLRPAELIPPAFECSVEFCVKKPSSQSRDSVFCRFRRLNLAAIPVNPLPSKNKVAGSGTALLCWAAVICPVNGTMLPGSIATSLTLKTKEPLPQVVCWPGIPPVGSCSQFVSLNVKTRGVLLKSIKTPPMLSLVTVPVMVAVKVVWFEPLMPWGAVKVTWSVNGVL